MGKVINKAIALTLCLYVMWTCYKWGREDGAFIAKAEQEKMVMEEKETYNSDSLVNTDYREFIKKEALAKWQDDYFYADFEIEKQTEAYEWLVKEISYEDFNNCNNRKIMDKSLERWETDFVMVRFEYEHNLKAWRDIEGDY